MGGGGKISVGAAESFDSARKAIFHVSHLMSEKRAELGAPSVASAERDTSTRCGTTEVGQEMKRRSGKENVPEIKLSGSRTKRGAVKGSRYRVGVFHIVRVSGVSQIVYVS